MQQCREDVLLYHLVDLRVGGGGGGYDDYLWQSYPAPLCASLTRSAMILPGSSGQL